MAFYNVPIDNEEELYQIITNLDNTNIGVKVRYNSRNDCWYMSIYDINNVLLIDSIPMLSRIIKMFSLYGLMPEGMYGDFIMQDTKDGLGDCTRENLGNINKLFYVNAD